MATAIFASAGRSCRSDELHIVGTKAILPCLPHCTLAAVAIGAVRSEQLSAMTMTSSKGRGWSWASSPATVSEIPASSSCAGTRTATQAPWAAGSSDAGALGWRLASSNASRYSAEPDSHAWAA